MKIINLDKRQYLSPEAFGVEPTLDKIAKTRDGVMQALAVLCADGNNRGGGDLRSDAEIIGSWAGDRVALVSTTVCDATLSAPGLEDVPLLEQVVKGGGVDVSEAVIAGILEGEREYSGLAGLPADPAQRLVFRRLFGDEVTLLKPGENGKYPAIKSLPVLVGLLHGEIEETLTATFAGMAAGANRIAEAFNLKVRWSFTDLMHKVDGKGELKASFLSNEGVVATLELASDGEKLTAKSVFETLGLSKVLDVYQAPKAMPEEGSLLPAAVAQIVSDTLAGKDLGGKD